MTRVNASTDRGRVQRVMALVLVLATSTCGSRSVNSGAGATDGAAGNDGADGGGHPSCPQPFTAGGACAPENLVCAPPFECRRCIGGFKLVPLRSPLPCVCRAGRWDCRSVPSNQIADCIVDEPLSCQDARDVYRDPGCREHAPCTP